jgi:hypothetical protein
MMFNTGSVTHRRTHKLAMCITCDRREVIWSGWGCRYGRGHHRCEATPTRLPLSLLSCPRFVAHWDLSMEPILYSLLLRVYHRLELRNERLKWYGKVDCSVYFFLRWLGGGPENLWSCLCQGIIRMCDPQDRPHILSNPSNSAQVLGLIPKRLGIRIIRTPSCGPVSHARRAAGSMGASLSLNSCMLH